MHGVGLNADLLLHAANLKGYIKVQLVIHLQNDVSSGEWSESGGSGSQLVVPDGQGQDAVGTVCSRGGLLAVIGLRISHDNVCASKHGLRTIAHHTQNRSRNVGVCKVRTKKSYENQQKS